MWCPLVKKILSLIILEDGINEGALISRKWFSTELWGKREIDDWFYDWHRIGIKNSVLVLAQHFQYLPMQYKLPNCSATIASQSLQQACHRNDSVIISIPEVLQRLATNRRSAICAAPSTSFCNMGNSEVARFCQIKTTRISTWSCPQRKNT